MAFAGLAVLCLHREAVAESAGASLDSVTERVRAVLRDDGGLRDFGAEQPEENFSERGDPVAATVLRGSGHAFVAVGSDGQPLGAQLSLLTVSVEGPTASATECVLREGPEEEAACPARPFSLVDCATWGVPAEPARSALRAARAALFVRVFEKKFSDGPREEQEDDDEGGVEGGVVGGVDGGTTNDFLAAVRLLELGKHRIRVSDEWAGYASARSSARYARVVAAAEIVSAAFDRPSDAPRTPPPAAAHAEFSLLLATLPLDARYWWWVRERMVLMSGTLGVPGDLERIEGFLAPATWGPSGFRTRAYALEALARRTGRDTRCEGTRRLDDAAAVAAWKRRGN